MQEFDELPRPTFSEPTLRDVMLQASRPLGALLLYAVAVALLTSRRFRRFAPAAA